MNTIYQWTLQERDTYRQKVIFSDEETFDNMMYCTALDSTPIELETPWGKIHARVVPYLDGSVEVWKREVV